MRDPMRVLAASCLALLVVACSEGASARQSISQAARADASVAQESDASGLDVMALRIEPAHVQRTLQYGEEAHDPLRALAVLADGSERDVTHSVSWKTTSALATISAGDLRSLAPGAFVVTAEAQGKTASIDVRYEVHGERVLGDVNPNVAASLRGEPSPELAPNIAYPLDGALFPRGLREYEFQVERGSPEQTVARLAFRNDVLTLDMIAPCEPIEQAAIGCAVRFRDAALEAVLAGASEVEQLSTQIRLVDAKGEQLGESKALDLGWAPSRLRGGVYYWRTVGRSQTGIYRYDFDQEEPEPEQFWVNDPDSPKIFTGEPHPCMGCHAVSANGEKLALTLGGSDPSAFVLVDVASKDLIASRVDAPYATFTAFNPDGSRILQAFDGSLSLRSADTKLTDLASSPLDGLEEALSQPSWSADGRTVAFVGWEPGQHGAGPTRNGDLVAGAQIYVAESDGVSITSAPELLVPREADRSSYYPAVSSDSAWLVFASSRCDGPTNPGPYGNGACDGYDDLSARLRMVSRDGGAPIELARASGADTWTSSWPRFSPEATSFRGKRLYWIAFSSRRPYGLRIQGSTDGTSKPQLWFTAVLLPEQGAVHEDPSFAPIWLPAQDDDLSAPTGNHAPQWTAKVVTPI